jgi:hypothetical protein
VVRPSLAVKVEADPGASDASPVSRVKKMRRVSWQPTPANANRPSESTISAQPGTVTRQDAHVGSPRKQVWTGAGEPTSPGNRKHWTAPRSGMWQTSKALLPVVTQGGSSVTGVYATRTAA